MVAPGAAVAGALLVSSKSGVPGATCGSEIWRVPRFGEPAMWREDPVNRCAPADISARNSTNPAPDGAEPSIVTLNVYDHVSVFAGAESTGGEIVMP